MTNSTKADDGCCRVIYNKQYPICIPGESFLIGVSVAYILMCNVGNLRCDIYAIDDLLQRHVRPLNIGYKYSISISVRGKIDLSRPSGGSSSISKRYTYGTSKRSESF